MPEPIGVEYFFRTQVLREKFGDSSLTLTYKQTTIFNGDTKWRPSSDRKSKINIHKYSQLLNKYTVENARKQNAQS